MRNHANLQTKAPRPLTVYANDLIHSTTDLLDSSSISFFCPEFVWLEQTHQRLGPGQLRL